MATEVHYTNSRTGITYAYLSESRYDPEKGYSVPKRTYLGRVDPNTGKVIPSSHVRGRKKKTESVDAPSYLAEYEATLAELNSMRRDFVALKSTVKELENQHSKTTRTLQRIYQEIGTMLPKESDA